jgi:hypothetical protein
MDTSTGAPGISWDDNDFGMAPDGTTYAIHSEQSRGERRIYWIRYQGADLPERYYSDGWITKSKAKTAASRHWRERAARRTQDAT